MEPLPQSANPSQNRVGVATIPRTQATGGSSYTPTPYAAGPQVGGSTFSPTPYAAGPQVGGSTFSPTPYAAGPIPQGAPSQIQPVPSSQQHFGFTPQVAPYPSFQQPLSGPPQLQSVSVPQAQSYPSQPVAYAPQNPPQNPYSYGQPVSYNVAQTNPAQPRQPLQPIHAPPPPSGPIVQVPSQRGNANVSSIPEPTKQAVYTQPSRPAGSSRPPSSSVTAPSSRAVPGPSAQAVSGQGSRQKAANVTAIPEPTKQAVYSQAAKQKTSGSGRGASTSQQPTGATTSSSRSQPGPQPPRNTQTSGNTQTLSIRSQGNPTQATASHSQTGGPSPEPTPIAVVFGNSYRMPRGNLIPQELRNRQQDLFPGANAGERGWARKQWKTTSSTGQPLMLVWVVVAGGEGRDTRRGWLPANDLIPGERRREHMPIELPQEQLRPLPTLPGPTQQQKNSVLYRTIQGLWQMIRDNRNTVLAPVASQDETALVEETLYGPDLNQYVDLLYSSFVPEVRAIMDDGQFSARDFINPNNRIRHITNSWPGDEYACIYAMITEGPTHGIQKFMDQRPEDLFAFYGGQTSNAPTRCLTGTNSHTALLAQPGSQNGKCIKYQIARTGRRTYWVPSLLVHKGDPRVQRLTWKNFLHIAELTLIVLMRSWNPLVLRTANVQQMGSYARDYEAATIFKGLIDRVAEKTGWRPTPVFGTNWTTPIFSAMPEDRVWVSWYDTGRRSYFFRTRCTLFRDKRSRLQVKLGGRKVNLPAELFNKGHLKPGDGVHLVFELCCDEGMLNFRPHVMSFFRIPRICSNPEYEKLASLALKYQWVDNDSGQWKEAVAQRVILFNGVQAVGLRTGMRILSILTRTIYTSGANVNPPNWLLSTSRNTVKFIEYNHLKQSQKLIEVPQGAKPWPADYTVAQNAARLQQYIQQKGSDTVIGNRDRMAGGARQNCDLCYSLMTTQPCDYNANTHSCFRCRAFNRPCTWTYKGTGDNTTDALGRPKKPNTIDMLVTGGSLEDLGIPTHILSAAKKAKQPQEMVQNIDPPFAADIDFDVKLEQDGAPTHQNLEEDSDDGD